jgi:hypothetical protein
MGVYTKFGFFLGKILSCFQLNEAKCIKGSYLCKNIFKPKLKNRVIRTFSMRIVHQLNFIKLKTSFQL